MSRSFRVFLVFLCGVPALLVCLAGANFWIAMRLLHLDRDLFASARSKAVPVAKPVVLKFDETGYMRAAAHKLVDILANDVRGVPDNHALLIDISWIRRANPYPPLLAELSDGYRGNWGYCSFGYIGVDNRYHQVTIYSGESDTLPSPLVRKVRRDWTHAGDYFTKYIFFLSREVEATDENGRPTQTQIDRIDWGSYRGGSYNGFEEVFFNIAAMLVELILIGVLSASVLARRRHRGRKRIEPPASKSLA